MDRPPRSRIAVYASGGGSNLQALLDHLNDLGDAARADVVLVLSNRASAGALDRAASRAIATTLVRDVDDAGEQLAALGSHAVDLVVLAGYLRRVPDAVTARFRGRMLNVHPALLPAFGGPGMYGTRVHAAVLAAGARVSGATVHFVDDEYDRGPIVAQWPVPVLAGDSPASLAERVLRVEHLLLPRAVHAVAAGSIALGDDGVVRADHGAQPDEPFTLGPLAAAAAIDAVLGAPAAPVGRPLTSR